MSNKDSLGAIADEDLLKMWEPIWSEMPLPDDGELMIPVTIRPGWKLEDLPIGMGPMTLLSQAEMARLSE